MRLSFQRDEAVSTPKIKTYDYYGNLVIRKVRICE